MRLKSHIFIVRDWVLGQSLTIILLRFFTQCSLRNITFRTLRFFHFSLWNGALTSAFSSTSVNLPLFWFYLGGALTFAFSRSVVRSLAGPRAHSLARLVEIWSGLVWRGFVFWLHFFFQRVVLLSGECTVYGCSGGADVDLVARDMTIVGWHVGPRARDMTVSGCTLGLVALRWLPISSTFVSRTVVERIAVSSDSGPSQCPSTCSFGGEFVPWVGLSDRTNVQQPCQ